MQTALPAKWRIFRIANYLHMAGVASFGLLIIYLISTFGLKTLEDFLFLLLFAACIACLLANTIISLHFLERCYPDKQYSITLSVISVFILVLSCLVIISMTILFCYGFYASFFERRKPDLFGILLLVVLFSTIISGIYICWFQVVLKKLLKKNYRLALENFLNTEE